jgi:plasmid maintenance system antidote protein VapI
MPGSYILDELAARGWTVARLATKMGLPATRVTVIKRVICGDIITPDFAQRLGKAFGTSSTLWLNLDKAYRADLAAAGGVRVKP